MKGRRPTKKQKHLLRLRRLNPEAWLVCKNLTHIGQLHVRNRDSGRERVLQV